MKNKKESKRDNIIDNDSPLVGYQAAIDLWIYMGNQGWDRFNVMLTANAIIIASIGIAMTSNQKLSPTFSIILSVAGFILCLLWISLMMRSSELADYFTLTAREIEEKYLSPTISTVSRGGKLSNGNSITITINGQEISKRLSWPARIMHAKYISYIVIVIFIVLYIIAFFINVAGYNFA